MVSHSFEFQDSEATAGIDRLVVPFHPTMQVWGEDCLLTNSLVSIMIIPFELQDAIHPFQESLLVANDGAMDQY